MEQLKTEKRKSDPEFMEILDQASNHGEGDLSEPEMVEIGMSHALSSGPATLKSKFQRQSLELDTRIQSTEFDRMKSDQKMVNLPFMTP